MNVLDPRAYGAVYKAMHKESGQLLAIKQVPVDADLQDIIKEISIMQQCDRSVMSVVVLVRNCPWLGNSIADALCGVLSSPLGTSTHWVRLQNFTEKYGVKG